MPAEPSRAVFLSYASQDADAASRLCSRLRTTGVEVWLDQDGGLVGGDAWDAKIRGQIASCALFVPIISANTQARREGYFRLEWKLAAQRTHMMSERTAFLLPVVIDATRDAEADVPAEFRAVQWTRLPEGETNALFYARVKQLLAGADGRDASPSGLDAKPGRLGEACRPKKGASWLIPALVAFAAAVGMAIWQPWRNPASSAAPSANASAATGIKSVAVLPFLNRSGDAEQEYFSDGLTEEILGALRRERDLTVPGNTSCFSFKGRTVSGAEIARALNVSRLVEGSVQRDGSRVRIRVTLSRPADNSSEELGTFTEELTDIFALQEKIARAVVAKLTRRKTTEPLAVLTKSAEAYDAYLRGRALQTSSSWTIFESIKSYERAVELDPAFALAWARLAEARLRTYYGGWDQSPTLAESVRVAVERALAAHPDLPEALIVRGNWARLVEQDFAKAQRDLDRAAALQGPTAELRSVQRLLALDQGDRLGSLRFARDCVALDPGNGDLLNSVAQQFSRLGDFAAADPIYARASTIAGNEISQRRGRIELRHAWRGPGAALRLIETQGDVRGGRGGRTRMLIALGRMEEAGRLIDQDLAEGKEPPSLLLHRLGRVEPARRLAELSCHEARLELQRGNRASGIWSSLVTAELVLGHRDEALAALGDWRREQLKLKSEYRRVNGFHHFVIGLYTQLGRPDEDLALMREYIAAGWHRGYEWRHDWMLAPLRDDPRFQEIVRQEEALAKAQPDPTDP